LYLIVLALPMARLAMGQQPGLRDEFLVLESRLVGARIQQVHLLAPTAFSQAANLYTEVEAARRKGATPRQLSAIIARTEDALARAAATADKTRQFLARTFGLRQEAARLDETGLARADDLLRQASGRYEAGAGAEAEKLATAADLEYSRAAAGFLRETQLKEAANGIELARPQVPPEFLQRAEAEYKSAAALLDANVVLDIRSAEARLAVLIQLLYPPFYRNPPLTLTLDGFTIHVATYTSRQWDFLNSRIIHANGTGWISFDCRQKNLVPYPGIATTLKALRVVEAVKDPLKEIGLADARRLNPQHSLESIVELSMPTYVTTAEQVTQLVSDLTHFFPAHDGDIKVHFDDLTIQPGAQPGTGIVLAGTATYPTSPPVP
jgi:hypothetical protein